MSNRKLTELEVLKAARLYENGKSMAVIAGMLEVDAQTLSRKLAGKVRVRKGPGSSLGSDAVEEMVLQYAEGESTTAIGSRFGINAVTVAAHLKRAGVPLRAPGFRHGEEHHAWKGGRTIDSFGYVHLRIYKDDPFFCMGSERAEGYAYVLEHRYVMARHLGRPLRDDETVHHKDGDRQHNKLANLQLRSSRHGKGSAFHCVDCGSHNIVPDEIGTEVN